MQGKFNWNSSSKILFISAMQFDYFQNFLWLRSIRLIQKLFYSTCTSYWTKGYHTRLLQAVLPKSLLLSAHTWRCLFSFYQRNDINEREVAASRKRYMKYCLNYRFTLISNVHINHRWSKNCYIWDQTYTGNWNVWTQHLSFQWSNHLNEMNSKDLSYFSF